MSEDKCVACGNFVPEGRMVCVNCENCKPNFNTTKITVLLDKIVDVKDFVSLTSKCKDDVIISSGKFAVDAKSIMGLFSLDLTKPQIVEFHGIIPSKVKEEIKNLL